MDYIISFFIAHWVLAVFFQSFYLHRYCAHNIFILNKFWGIIFQIGTVVSQGSSNLRPYPYVLLHREHHAYSDTIDDPHSPINHNLIGMVVNTYKKYFGYANGSLEPKLTYQRENIPASITIEKIGDSLLIRLAFVIFYTWFYVSYSPHWSFYFLLPIHYFMGPIHGMLVNWCGHSYGYRNYDNRRKDQSLNTLAIDFLAAGELYQNNHHRYPKDPNFAKRWYEFDTTYFFIKLFHLIGILNLKPKRK